MDLQDPWFVAVWPGMGNVAMSAGDYLIEQLDVQLRAEYPAQRHFDVERVQVKDGIVGPGRLPRNRFYGWKNPGPGRDLVIFTGEAQPTIRSYAFCQELLRVARSFGVTRVVTFAAMVTASHPATPSRVFAMATEGDLLDEVRSAPGEVEVLEEGEITGLNGTLLAAAAASGLEGLGLLGEVPQIAANVPYLKASQAVLEVFAPLAGVDLEFGEIRRKSEAVEQSLVDLVQRLQRAVSRPQNEPQESTWGALPGETSDDADDEERPAEDAGAGDARERLPDDVLARIETLFLDAARDRSKALELKEELDRHGVFKVFEDRFLDLFA